MRYQAALHPDWGHPYLTRQVKARVILGAVHETASGGRGLIGERTWIVAVEFALYWNVEAPELERTRSSASRWAAVVEYGGLKSG